VDQVVSPQHLSAELFCLICSTTYVSFINNIAIYHFFTLFLQ
jgi:hypothetical protein